MGIKDINGLELSVGDKVLFFLQFSKHPGKIDGEMNIDIVTEISEHYFDTINSIDNSFKFGFMILEKPKTKTIKLDIVRNYHKSTSIEVQVPSHLTESDLQAYLVKNEGIDSLINEAIDSATLNGGDEETEYFDIEDKSGSTL